MKKFHVFAGGIDVERNKIEASALTTELLHCHDRYEILYVIEGQGKCLIEGAQYPVKPRSVFVFTPLSYRAFYPDEGCIFDVATFLFDEHLVSESVREILKSFGMGENDISPAAFYNADNISDQIALLVDRVENANSFPEQERAKYLGLLISELILFISMASRENGGYDESELGARVIRYLNENAERDISLDRLARRFFVSKYHLCRAFKKHNGISVHGYINRKRVMYAKQLIESGETASRAAYQVGFGDYSAFYRAYVKIVGKSPTSSEK